MNFLWVPLLAVLVVGAALVYYYGAKRRSMSGAVFAMILTVVSAIILEPRLQDQVGTLMVGVSISLLLVAVALIGWVWNVVALIYWRRGELAKAGGDRSKVSVPTGDDWHPWVAWYPVHTERGWAWMRLVEARQVWGAAAKGEARAAEFREFNHSMAEARGLRRESPESLG